MKKFKQIYIEITNICNLNCSFCPKHSRKLEYMSVDNFKKIVEDISPYTNTICLHLMGEPLLHPNLQEIFEIARSNNLNIHLTTNGTLLEKHQDLLSQGYCKKISISIHSFEANTTQITLENYLQEIFEASKFITKNPNVYIEYRLWNQSADNNAKNTLNDKILNTASKFFKAKLDMNSPKHIPLSPNIYINFADIFKWPIETQEDLAKTKKYCYGLHSQFGILCDGTVVPCCLDNNGKINLGNILEQNLQDILSTPRAQRIRQGFSNHQAVEKFCQTCSFADRFLED